MSVSLIVKSVIRVRFLIDKIDYSKNNNITYALLQSKTFMFPERMESLWADIRSEKKTQQIYRNLQQRAKKDFTFFTNCILTYALYSLNIDKVTNGRFNLLPKLFLFVITVIIDYSWLKKKK